MPNKLFLQKIGLLSKEGTEDILHKKYFSYSIEVNLKNNTIHYGGSIVFNNTKKTLQNITKPEDWIVFECVNRLLVKGYKPKDIILEKVYPSGHGTSGRLDILVKKEGKAYLMIECKTWGKEFEKEYNKLQKNGGQLFTYFQQDKNTKYLMLYASRIHNENIEYRNEIVKIEDHYVKAGNVVDIYTRWNKLTNQNGIFEDWVNAYDFQNKLLTKKELKPLSETNSSFIFHEFLSILRKHSVSDKPNAFNKIFNLFLAKIYDEKKRASDELDFQWKEKSDNPVDFQIRLINLHREGMLEFLTKEIEGIEDSDFNQNLSDKEIQKKKKKWLKFNNVFAIKEVIDDESFDDNQRVLKEVVELLQKYQIRYPRKQQHLSDFFERLLTTGLKQESGQFFTPPPIARYIIKSIPVKEYIKENLNSPAAKLPAVIDYAVGSGHFITEMMEEYQNIINTLDMEGFFPSAITDLKTWRNDQYSWASKYIYGIEKDYRLVKVAKVGCYFYGDGLAQVVHGDGLDSFQNSKSYIGLLKQHTTEQDNEKFSFVISNPPYSVTSFKGDIKNEDVEIGFELYKYLTDQSSEIECLFIERTKQLLKDGGVAGIILPSSLLSNTGIYTKTREIIFKYFQIIGITKLGSSTFMATGTNTVILFLKRRNDNDWQNIKNSIDNFFTNFQDVTVNGIEHIFSKYVKHIWKNIDFSDYITLCKKTQNKNIEKHEIYQGYGKKLKVKGSEDVHEKILKTEKDKLLYFILAYSQKVTLTKTGEKKSEKQFLGYEFSNRRGHEGMHPIQRSKSIDECTSLFDPNTQENPEKANFYTYKNFLGEDFEIDKSMKKNVSVVDLVDMMTFDRVDFEKIISLSVKKKIKIESKWKFVILENFLETLESGKRPKGGVANNNDGIPSVGGEHVLLDGSVSNKGMKFVPEKYFKKSKQGILQDLDILICKDGALTGKTALFKRDEFAFSKGMINEHVFILRTGNNTTQKYLFSFLFSENGQELLKSNITGQAQGGLNRTNLLNIKISLPPKNIQEKIVKEIEKIEKKEEENKKRVEELRLDVESKIEKIQDSKVVKLQSIMKIVRGASPRPIKKFIINDKNGVNWIKIGDVLPKSKYILNTEEKITEEGAKKSRKVKKGDFILSNSMSFGRPYIVQKEGCIHDGWLLLSEFSSEIDKIFLYYLLLSNFVQEQFISFASGGTAVDNLNIEKVSNVKIPLPSLPEQQKIVDKIEKIEQKIETLQAEIENSKKQKKEVLKKYL